MASDGRGRVAILYPGDLQTRRSATHDNNRFSNLFGAFVAAGVEVEPAVYHDDFCAEVRAQLCKVAAVLVWVNPIEDGRNRALLDAMLQEVAQSGVFVSSHPAAILKLGTKEVLFRTRELGWGSDTHLYVSMAELRRELPRRLGVGKARVLKQYRGSGGDGVWKVQLASGEPRQPHPQTVIRVRHAKRGCHEEEIVLEEFFRRCARYFAGDGRMIDQEFQERLAEGMVRCYLVQNQVAGFGHQAINALYPAPPGAPATVAPEPGPRLYYPPGKPEFQALKQKLEEEWVPAAQQLLELDTASLPIIWDCDFLLGPRSDRGEDTYVLCEINVSSVAPFPESAIPFIVSATRAIVSKVRS